VNNSKDELPNTWLGLGKIAVLIGSQVGLFWVLGRVEGGPGDGLVYGLTETISGQYAPLWWYSVVALLTWCIFRPGWKGRIVAAESEAVKTLRQRLEEEHTKKSQELELQGQEVAEKEQQVDERIQKEVEGIRKLLLKKELELHRQMKAVQAREQKAEHHKRQLSDQIRETKRWQELNEEKANQIKGAVNLLRIDSTKVGQALKILGEIKHRPRRPVPPPLLPPGNIDDVPF
jgi:hypothetical protein